MEADDFTAAFDDASVDVRTDNVGSSGLGSLSITNLTPPSMGSGNNKEVTVTIDENGSTGKIVIGFTLDWSVSGNVVNWQSDDTALDIVYTERDNSSTTVSIANPTPNLMSITNDGSYGGNATMNLQALNLITKLNAFTHATGTAPYVFDNLESWFAIPGTTLDVTVDVSNLNTFYGVSQMTTITSTIDII